MIKEEQDGTKLKMNVAPNPVFTIKCSTCNTPPSNLCRRMGLEELPATSVHNQRIRDWLRIQEEGLEKAPQDQV